MTMPYTNRPRAIALLLACLTLIASRDLIGQDLEIGIIDIHGLKRVPTTEVRQALTFKEGDTISLAGAVRPAFLAESESRLTKLTHVARAHIYLVCCDKGRAVLFVGIEEDGAVITRFRAAPGGSARLEADIVRAGEEFGKALLDAVQRGDAAEDDSEGHALAHNSAMRAIQERFITYAARDLPELRRVLRESSEAGHRALAAQVLGYVADKQALVDDLVFAMSDPSEEVRNNAMRALLVFAEARPTAVRPVPRIPPDPFIAFLRSPVWTDLNKASGALTVLSERRDPELLAKLGREALEPLVEMARWKSEGHAKAAFLILGRLAGLSEEAIRRAWDGRNRAAVIEKAIARRDSVC